MADNKKIDGLTAAATAALTDLCVLLVGGLARKMTLANLKTVLGIGATPLPTLHVRDEKADGTAGGTLTIATWNVRTLNTVMTNTITGASLATNQITLPAGTYEIDATAPAYLVNSTRLRLRDTTGGATLIAGQNANAHATASSQMTTTHLRGRFTLSVESVLELQQWAQATRSSDGAGFVMTDTDEVEVYADVQIRKVA